jgi:hypothetical protein
VKHSPGRSRIPLALSPALNQRLNVYTLAASAAGVGLLALTQPCEARIMYTKAHQIIGTNGVYALDLTHDGTIDFLIQENGVSFSSSGYNGLAAKPAFGNGVEGSNGLATALDQGALIGPGQRFISGTSSAGEAMFRVACSIELGCSTIGQWGNVRNRYLGLKFLIDGKTHYGWARLSVALRKNNKIVALLTGYAFETVANKAIHAGQTSGGDDSTSGKLADPGTPDTNPRTNTGERASLGQLALGAGQYSLSRRP